jgi:probable F420-dependent oxidoreductase
MSTKTELAISIPQASAGGVPDPASIRGFLERADALGYHSAWVVEQIMGTIPSLEPVEVLTFAAAVTRRIRLGAAVLLTALRSPVHLAKTLGTLDHLSGGRLDVGVGLGGNTRIYPAFGLTPERRVARFAEGLRVMKRLWTEPRVSLAGDFYTLDNVAMEPKPVQKPYPPIWFGGQHPNALRRAVELGDGFMGAGSASSQKFIEQVKVLQGILAAAGRDPASFPIGKRVYIAVDADRARAARRLAEWFGAFYGRPQTAEEVSIWGGPAECVDRLGELVAGGARLLLLNPVFDEREHMERFMTEIAPKL